MWLLAGALRAGVIGYSAALVVLWHCTQLAVAEGAYLWILENCGITAKLALVWQLLQVAAPAADTGIWLLPMVGGAKPVKPLWQSEHSPVLTWLPSFTEVPLPPAKGRVWKPV
jgi:hypothetical protein